MLFNAHFEPMAFTIPGPRWGDAWRIEIDTREWEVPEDATLKAGDVFEVEARSVVVLRRA